MRLREIRDRDEAELVMAMATGGLENNGYWCDIVQREAYVAAGRTGAAMVKVGSIARRVDEAHETVVRLGMCRCGY
jgi:hypothetical protein